MSKAYSTKALPAGTILREWRLEQVLGVGGFGIVYKGRGIYFDELVAIKEYFPSSISERDEDATVVPIDSDAEEVHALGLKKFVEEAKLLWNLSTPTRHPNIVSVRSLFEIHGTAYMVMDFEDGLSLSNLLKQGTRWNEASLTALFKPIAEGLDRAHRVGVLHRDIKPPNILITEDSRPVLIDFGSARFESGDATSTKVTFHTPPYAAIEQYVRTYDQGPWTDIYALGVVLYECITGTKPPEVLERMHGGDEKRLSDGEWFGYSRKFLTAVDAALAISPVERPQSIPLWLALFDAPDDPDDVAAPADEPDVDATRIAAFSATKGIKPVAPSPPGFTRGERIDTPVPDDTSEVRFKRAGQDTNASTKADIAKKLPPQVPATPDAADAPAEKGTPPEAPTVAPPKPAAAVPDKRKPPSKAGSAAASKRKPNLALLGGIAAIALVGLGAGAWYLTGGFAGDQAPDPALAQTGEEIAPVDVDAAGGVAAALQALVDDARKGGASSAALAKLTAATTQLAGMNPSREAEMNLIAVKASAEFSATVLGEAEAHGRRLARELPWANPAKQNAAAGETAVRQRIARDIRSALSGVRAASAAAAAATDPAAALTAARQALARNGAFNTAIAQAYRSGNKRPPATIPAVTAATTAADTVTTAPQAAAQPAAQAAQPAADGKVGKPSKLFPAKFGRFNSIVKAARDTADDVIKLGRGGEPGADASAEEKNGYRTRQANAKAARDYLTYLDGLVNSMRGDRSEADVDLNITNAERTRTYLQQMLGASRAARK